MLGILIVLVLMVMGGLIAFLGDKIGTKVGKKRLTMFDSSLNIRPSLLLLFQGH